MKAGICPWCKVEADQEHVYVDLGYSVPVEPENCPGCISSASDWRYGIPLATEEEMVTGWHRPLDEYPEYLDMSDWAFGPAPEPSEVFCWSIDPEKEREAKRKAEQFGLRGIPGTNRKELSIP